MAEIITISSAKGGVGKTTFSTNLGVALSELDRNVLLIDGSVTTPDVSLHMGIPFHVPTLEEVMHGRADLRDSIYQHASGLKIISGNIHVGAKRLRLNKFQRVLDSVADHDHVLIDSSAGLGEEAMVALQVADTVIVITNPELPAVVDASKATQVARDLGKNVKVVINRHGRFKKELSEEEVQTILLESSELLGRIPEDVRVPNATRDSTAVLHHAPYAKSSIAIREIAHKLVDAPYRSPSFFKRLLG